MKNINDCTTVIDKTYLFQVTIAPKALAHLKTLRPFSVEEMKKWATAGPGDSRRMILGSRPEGEEAWITLAPTVMIDGQGQISGSMFHIGGADKRFCVSIKATSLWPDIQDIPEELRVKLTINPDQLQFVSTGLNRNMSTWQDGLPACDQSPGGLQMCPPG